MHRWYSLCWFDNPSCSVLVSARSVQEPSAETSPFFVVFKPFWKLKTPVFWWKIVCWFSIFHKSPYIAKNEIIKSNAIHNTKYNQDEKETLTVPSCWLFMSDGCPMSSSQEASNKSSPALLAYSYLKQNQAQYVGHHSKGHPEIASSS